MDAHKDKVMPIAIIGVGGRFPCDDPSPEGFWEFLLSAKNAMTEIPVDRYNIDAFYHPDGERVGTHNFRGGHFMKTPLDAFDAPFFSIAPAEAKAMDPQQRMCLEVAYEALENAGIRLDQVAGSNTSCFVGSFTHDYQNLLSRDPEFLPFYNGTGTASAALSNRISWFFNLLGASLSIDTACSSSLVALHLACQSLRTGESKMSIVGGVNVICSPETNSKFSNLYFTSPDSKSQTFDEKGNGYGRGEGICFVIIKPLEDAIRDSDPIRAVIRNTGSNQDGKTLGFTLPSRTSQAHLIRTVYDQAGLNMADTGYFELHGTGTVAGDSAETQALGETIGKSRLPGMPLWMGSAKASIGHLEGASGIAGVIKAIFILERGLIPPQALFEVINPRIKLQEWNLAIPTKVTKWPYEGLRRVSVNSFGFGGANAHIILDDAFSYVTSRGISATHNTNPTELKTDGPDLIRMPKQLNNSSTYYEGVAAVEDRTIANTPSPRLIVWSAHEQSGLERQLNSWKGYIQSKMLSMSSHYETNNLLQLLAYTAATRRTVFPWKSFTVCSTPEAIVDGISKPAPPMRSSQVTNIGFIFTGQGAQYSEMGQELMVYNTYSKSIYAADKYLRSLGCPWSLIQVLYGKDKLSSVHDTEFSQPLCTALQIALVDLLRTLNIRPIAVIGHSSGEIAAAYAKGAITTEAALTIAYHRGRLAASLPKLQPELCGGMLVAGISETSAIEYIKNAVNGRIVVACVNSQQSVTMAGDLQAIIEMEALLKAKGVFFRRVKVNVAYHSHHMQAISELYRKSLEQIQPLPAKEDTPLMFSCVTGHMVDNSELGPDYWVANLLSKVQFSDALLALINHSESNRRQVKRLPYVNTLVEVGPHGALQGHVRQSLGALEVVECATLSIMDRNKNAAHSLLESVGALYQRGHEPDIAAANMAGETSGEQHFLVDLPPFPWNHTHRYWHESPLSYNYRFKSSPRKDLLGIRDNDGNNFQPRWRNFLRLSENPWIQDHCIQGKIIYPAAGMIAMALEAISEISKEGRVVEGYELRNITIKHALIVPQTEEGVETMLHLSPWRVSSLVSTSSWQEFAIYCRTGKTSWLQNCVGQIRVQYQQESQSGLFADETKTINTSHQAEYKRILHDCGPSVSPTGFYASQANIGYQLGPMFQNVVSMSHRKDKTSSVVRVPDISSQMPYNFTHSHLIHPCTMDALIHSSLLVGDGSSASRTPAVPTEIGRIFISTAMPSNPGALFHAYSIVKPRGLRSAEANVYASTGDWHQTLVSLERVILTQLGGSVDPAAASASNLRKIASRLEWNEDISYLNGNHIGNLCRHTDLKPPTGQNPLEKLMWLFAHKNPDLTILEIGANEGKVTDQVLNALKSNDGELTPWFKSYTATDRREDIVQALCTRFSEWQPSFNAKILLLEEDLERQGLQLQSYDCILLHVQSLNRISINQLTSITRALLKTRGKLIMISNDPFNSEELSLSQDLCDSELDVFDYFVIENPDCSTSSLRIMNLAMEHSSAKYIPQEVLIVNPLHHSSRSRQLSDSLEREIQSFGVNHSTIILPEAGSIDLSKKCCIVLCDLTSPVLFDIASEDFEAVRKILLYAKSTIWITTGATIECSNPKLALITGLSRSIHLEQPGSSLTTIDLEYYNQQVDVDTNCVIKVLCGLAHEEADREFTVRGGQLMIPRIRLDRRLIDVTTFPHSGRIPEPGQFVQPGRALTLAIGSPGVLNGLYFQDDASYSDPLSDDDVEIQVKASGLSLTDLMVALDQSSESVIGLECSGIVSRVGAGVQTFKPGDAVMTWRPGTFSSFVRNSKSMVLPMPIGMTFAVAASLPIIYCTAYQALVESARLQKGETVLIHEASGSVGQAAIIIAKGIDADIFATVTSSQAKLHLMEVYGIPEGHIFSSRDIHFAQGILRVTGGNGVNVLLNSLAGEARQQSWLCLSRFGRFVELGQRDIAEKSSFDIHPPIRNVSFSSVSITGFYQQEISKASTLFKNAMEFYQKKNCQPVCPVHVMNFSQLHEGLKLLHSGNCIGKVVLTIHNDDTVMVVPPPMKVAQFSDDASYMIAGGLGGVGQHIARWMARLGARNILLLSRRGVAHPDAQKLVNELAVYGTRITPYACDISNAEQVQQTILHASKIMPPIRGIIQAAMALSDAFFQTMTPEQWNSSIRTKGLGTWNLHCAAPNDLDFFVMLSSVSSIAGLRGGTNYAASNSFLDALAHYRRTQGLPAVSINVGTITDVGYLVGRPDVLKSVIAQGYVGISGDELINIIQSAINGELTPGHPMPCQVITDLTTGGFADFQGIELPHYLEDPRMWHLRSIDTTGASEGDRGKSWKEQLSQITCIDSGVEIISAALATKLARELMMAVEDIDLSKPVTAYGVDSLTAVEIRAWSLRELQADISIFDIVGNASIPSLSSVIVNNSKFTPTELLPERASKV